MGNTLSKLHGSSPDCEVRRVLVGDCPDGRTLQFIQDALSDRFTMSELCARYGISRRIGYKWLERYAEEGRRGLQDRSRTPHHCPHRIPAARAEQLCELRRQHPFWSCRDRGDDAVDPQGRVESIDQTWWSFDSEPRHPLVTGLLADAELGTEFRHGLPTLQHASDKLSTL